MRGKMQVVRVHADRSITVLGHCDFVEGLRPGDVLRVREPWTFENYQADVVLPQTISVGTFRVIPLRDARGELPLAIEARDDGPPLEWLPGWAPVRERGA